MTSWCWLDGAVGPTSEARVPVTDHGLTVGDGIFETLKVVDGTPFALTRHLRRLHRSADALGLEIGRSDDELRAACAEVITAADGPVGRLRLTVTGGPGPAGSERGTDGATVLLVTGVLPDWAPTAAVATVPFTRNPTSGLAGVLYASKVGFFAPDNFLLVASLLVLTMVIFGGMGSITGVIIGAFILQWLPNVLRDYVDPADRFIYFGALIIVMMIFRPQGIIPSKRRAREIKLSESGIGGADGMGTTPGAGQGVGGGGMGMGSA